MMNGHSSDYANSFFMGLSRSHMGMLEGLIGNHSNDIDVTLWNQSILRQSFTA